MSTLAEVRMWGTRIGAVALAEGQAHATFEYDPAFVASGIEISPLTMPLSSRIYSFPELPLRTFHGLPGLLADSLPDKFGNALIDAWLATQGRTPESFNASSDSATRARAAWVRWNSFPPSGRAPRLPRKFTSMRSSSSPRKS